LQSKIIEVGLLQANKNGCCETSATAVSTPLNEGVLIRL